MYRDNRYLTDIIVVKYNAPELEDKCIKSILDSTQIPYHLTVYDNYVYKENIAVVWNKLIRNSNSPYICLLNSDTEVEYAWLQKLVETFIYVKNVGCVGPSTNNSNNFQSGEKPDKIYVNCNDYYPDKCLSGFCLVFPKKVFNEIGGFPEDFGFYGQEVTFIDQLKFVGYKQIWKTDVMVLHHGAASAKIAEKNGEMNIKEEREKGKLQYQDWRKVLDENKNL